MVDVERASDGEFSSAPGEIYPRWSEFLDWARERRESGAVSWEAALLGPPSPVPRQVFAVGLNYRAHAEEGGYDVPTVPSIFTKFPSCLAGPYDDIALPSGNVDWEVELTVVIGAQCRNVPAGDAWRVVAGLAVGQDISERVTQHRPPVPQFSLGKSFPGFGPTGPLLVTPDELDDRQQLELTTKVNGSVMQRGNTKEMVFDVTQLVEYLSSVVTLYPGDIIFTGTPPGVGKGRNPPLFLRPGDVLESEISGIGSMRNVLVATGEAEDA